MTKHGWILQEDGNGDFVDENLGASKIEFAVIFSTRKNARETAYKLPTDVVRKVELDKAGKLVKVIPGR